MQPSSGRKPESERVVCATKTAARRVVTPGPTGPPSVAEEVDPERPGAVGVEAADHLAAPGAAELVVGRRRGAEDLHPGAGDGDADDQAVALSGRRRPTAG